jgi:hypothetical protein
VRFNANGELKRQEITDYELLHNEVYIKTYQLTAYTKAGVRGVRPTVPKDKNRVKVFTVNVFAI